MAERTISTVFTLKGENEYKRKVREINRELRNMRSEMKLSTTAFADNSDSLEALGQKYDILQRTYETQQKKVDEIKSALKYSEEALASFTKKGDELADELAKTLETIKKIETTGDEKLGDIEKLKEKQEKLEKSISQNDAGSDKFRIITDNWKNDLNNAQTELINTQRELSNTYNEIENARAKMEDFGDEAEDAGEDAKAMSDKTTTALDAISATAAALGLERVFGDIKKAIGDCIDAASKFETAFTGVYKTVDATPEQFADIKQNIKDLAREIPVSTTEIAGVAEVAGQLGIEAENIMNFTEVMIKLGTATNLSSEDGASALAKLANITKMSADDYGRLGSTVVSLGNHFATTERDVIEMATRLASTGAVLGLSEAQILAVAAALSSVGIEAEAGGTAFSKLLKDTETAVAGYNRIPEITERAGIGISDLKKQALEGGDTFKETANSLGYTVSQLRNIVNNYKQLENMSELSGNTVEEFVGAWKKDPLYALNDFISGLGKIDSESGGAITALEELGIKEVRMSNATLSLASSNDILLRALEDAQGAWDKNTALDEEASRAYATTEARQKILENSTEQLKQALGDDFITTLEPVLGLLTSLSASLADTADESPLVSSSLAGIGGSLGTVTAAAGAAGIIKGIAAGIKALGTGAGPALGAVGILSGLAAAALNYHENITEIPAETENLIKSADLTADGVEKARKAFENAATDADTVGEKVEALTDKLFKLSDKMQKSPADEAIIRECVDKLNGYLPGLGLTWDDITGKINMSREAVEKFAEKVEETAKLDRLKNYMDSLTSGSLDLEINSGLLENELEDAKGRLKDAQENLTEANNRGFLGNLIAIFDPAKKSVGDYSREVASAMTEVTRLREAIEKNKDAEEKAAQELAGIEKLYNEQLEKVQSMTADKTAESAAGGLTDDERVRSDTEEALEVGRKIGEAYGDGVIAGLDEKKERLRAAARGLHSIIEDEGRDTLDIRSPSHAAREIGRMWDEGLILGLRDRIGDIRRASESVSASASVGGLTEAVRKISRIPNQTAPLTPLSYSGVAEHAVRSHERITADIPVVLNLDGREISRAVSRVQWERDKTRMRARGG